MCDKVNLGVIILYLCLFRILFKDKDRNWEEIESKLKSESEVPVLKSSNKVEKYILYVSY